MKVSIVVPVYNAEKYIAECFNSIANQTYKNIEAIFVDDCSSDDSYKILQSLVKQHSGIGNIQYKIIRHENNKNVSAARNTGIREATGDYISFVDADDRITPDCIEYLLSFTKKYPTAEIIQSASISIDEKYYNLVFPPNIDSGNWSIIYKSLLTRIGREERELLEKISDKIIVLNEMEVLNFWLERSLAPVEFITPCGIWAKLYKKDFIGNNICFSEDLPNNQDVYFTWLCFKKATQVVISHKPIHCYRIRKDSISHDDNKNYLSLECNAICMEKMLNDLCDKRYQLGLSKWFIKRVKYCLSHINLDKEKVLVPRYFDILEIIKKYSSTPSPTQIRE